MQEQRMFLGIDSNLKALLFCPNNIKNGPTESKNQIIDRVINDVKKNQIENKEDTLNVK